ncbi:MsnO8 family LLM class oxidoreductase [uncultured Paenibacillus sp.]|uniref:MsnO8 family LLM class oxidoreductase n=1 Tax=uncultured Paenibacillus sp. TaxID=227322 RepID=UPI0015A7FC7B|nr:MsnO8 family LLM class oxidoreductase [uncultured Paenibacillus sp.]
MNDSEMKLKLSVLDLVPKLPGTTAEAALEQAIHLARQAEELGYLRYWTTEHHDMEALASAAPEVLLSAIGAATRRIRLGSGAVLLPHYSPLKVAENFRLLAALYPGRVDLGIGRAPGGEAHAAMALSGNFLERVGRYPQLAKDLSDLLADRYSYDDHPVAARPIPRVPLELWMLGTNVKSAGYAAELGTGYVFGQFMSDSDGAEILRAYREAFRPSVHRPESSAMLAVSVICAETEARAEALAAKTAEGFRARGGSPFQGFAGTGKQVREHLRNLQEKCGNDEFLIVSPISDYEERLLSYRLLAEKYT